VEDKEEDVLERMEIFNIHIANFGQLFKPQSLLSTTPQKPGLAKKR
jgi:hypothetical protein